MKKSKIKKEAKQLIELFRSNDVEVHINDYKVFVTRNFDKDDEIEVDSNSFEVKLSEHTYDSFIRQLLNLLSRDDLIEYSKDEYIGMIDESIKHLKEYSKQKNGNFILILSNVTLIVFCNIILNYI